MLRNIHSTMTNLQHHGATIRLLREQANLSQAQLAKQLPFTGSRISRIEAGELGLSEEEARDLALAIGSEQSKAFAEYLGRKWKLIASPGFDHVSREPLWKAEEALQKLDQLKDDPDLRNAFVKQVESCRQAIERCARFLTSVEHPIAFLGKPNVGKTTAICALTGLRDDGEKELGKQMGLQTGGGRTTTCEVHIRCGGEYSIVIEPYSEEELRQFVAEFCEQLLKGAGCEPADESRDGVGNAAEAERALRNMSDLKVRRIKEADGTFRVEDSGIAFAKEHPDRADLQIHVLARMNLHQRRRTSVSYPRGSALPEMKWLSKTFGQINFGLDPEFPLPRRIEISVPTPILKAQNLGLRVIDTRGIDEPSAPRRDLQSFLDDERAVIVLCSGFGDAPDAAAQSIIERARDTGLDKTLLERGALLVIPKGGEEMAVLDESGESVNDRDEAREIRREQIQATQFADLGVLELPIAFLDAKQSNDCERIQAFLLGRVMTLRSRVEAQVASLTATVDELIATKADADVRKVFQQAMQPIHTWLKSNQTIVTQPKEVHSALLSDIRELRYASSLRAAANLSRRGSWSKFDYWFGLGDGARRVTVVRAADQLTKLKGIVENTLNDDNLSDAHGFLRHFQTQVEESATAFFLDVQQLGEAAFADQLKEDRQYWEQCQNRWGQGPGYKDDIRAWTREWFSNESRKARHDFVEKEIQRRWQNLMNKLSEHLEPSVVIRPNTEQPSPESPK
jgi:transcriptional regulator with XRE-family HTH domain